MDSANWNNEAGTPANTHVNTRDLHLMRQLVDDLLSSPLVAVQVTKALKRGMSPLSSPFERYARLALIDAGAEDLARLASRKPLQLVPPGEGSLARIVCPNELEPGEVEVVTSVQDALNRLCGLVDALEDSADLLDSGSGRTIAISPLGGAFKPERPLYRSAHVPLPSIGQNEQPGIAYLNEVDWRALEHVAVTARAAFQSSMLPNMHQALMGAFAPPGSDWDVRTRLATNLGRLELPLQCDTAFDCSIPDATVMIRFTAPRERSFPHLADTEGNGQLCDTGKLAAKARLAYVLRLAVLLAAAGFGTSRHIEHVKLQALEPHAEELVCSLEFDRNGFVHETLTCVEDDSLGDPALRFNPTGVAQLLKPARLSFDAHARGSAASLSNPTRLDPYHDERPLPKPMRELFHAKRYRDIDTRHFHGTSQQVIEEARGDSVQFVLAAIASLEQVAEELESTCSPPDDDADARPLFCSNPLARAVVSLLDDDLAIGFEAQSYLDSRPSQPADERRLPRYFRAPNALFQARVGLSDLYSRLGDYRGAEAQADRCIALAPTTAQSYFLKADALGRQGRFAEAANVLTVGLRYAVSERDCGLLYYHLALALWKLGRKQESVAVHIYTMALPCEHAEKSAAIVRSLRKRADKPVIVHASAVAATREMARARIPLAPSEEARTLVVQAAVGLSCANAPEAAAPYVAALKRYFRNDPVIGAAAASIQHGVTVL